MIPEVIVLESHLDIAKFVSKIIVEEISKKPNLVLGLATGSTMIPLYKELVKSYKKKKVNFSRVRSFNLDEYWGLSPDDKNSLRSFMEKHFFNRVNLREKNINFLKGDVKNYKKECERYENKISRTKIDLQILGLGVNGHIGFNEPGSSFRSKTRRIEIEEETKNSQKRFFNKTSVPDYGLTMGVSTIMKAKKIILMANGKSKKKAIRNSLNGTISERVPASFLRRHKSASFVVDKLAMP